MTQTFTVTLSSKGQLTLPAEVRRALDLDQGARLELTLRDDQTVELVRPRFSRVADLDGLPAARHVDLTPAERRTLAHEERWIEKEARGS